MTREQLEHIIRACADITKQYDFIIMGSQAILGAYPNPPKEFTASVEADIYPLNAPELRDQIDGAIGEFADFHNLPVASSVSSRGRSRALSVPST